MTDENRTSPPASDEGKLNATGISLLVGDAALGANALWKFRHGVTEQKWTALTMLGWGVGSAAPAVFGKTPNDRKARIEAHKLDRFLNDQNLPIPRTVRDSNPLLQSRGLLDDAMQTFYTYPSEVLNGVFAAFSLGTMRAGWKARQAGDRANATQLYGGAAVLAGALSGMLIKEDPQAREKAKNGNALDKAVAWVKEKPLRLSGAFYMVNDGFLAAQAAREFQGGQWKHGLLTSAAVLAYGWANLQLFASSRDPARLTPLQDTQRDELQKLAAEIVAAQPKDRKEQTSALIQEYLAKERGVVPKEELGQHFEKQVEHATQRRIDAAADRGWRHRHEAQQRAQENRASQSAK